MNLKDKLLSAIALNSKIQKYHPEIVIAVFNNQVELSLWIYSAGYQLIINGRAYLSHEMAILKNPQTNMYYLKIISNNDDRVYDIINLKVNERTFEI